MGFFDSKSYQTTTNLSQNQTTSLGASEGSYNAAQDAMITVTDGGTFKEAVNLAKEVMVASNNQLGSVLGVVDKALTFSSDSGRMFSDSLSNNSNKFTESVTDLAKVNSTNNDQRLMTMFKWAAGAASLYGMVKAYNSRKK